MKEWLKTNKPDGMSERIYEEVMAHQAWLQEPEHVFAKRLYLEDRNCKGEDFTGFDLSNAIFKDCELSGCNFVNITMSEALFINCELRAADFDGDVTNTLFTLCDFDEDTVFSCIDMKLNYMLTNSHIIYDNGTITFSTPLEDDEAPF